jgi:GGDEF domain-containing protein
MEERLTHVSTRDPLFSHDGIHDSQTHLAAPQFFYEQLRRQIALAVRNQICFCLIKITFTKLPLHGQLTPVSAEDILHFSFELKKLTRTEDCIGRLGINECVILLADGELSARKLISRLYATPSLYVNNSLHIAISMVTSHSNETGLNLLKRLDYAPLSTH